MIAFDRAPGPRADGVRWIQGDIHDLEQVRAAARGAAVVVHLAGLASTDQASASPAEAMHANARGTGAVLEACGAAGVDAAVLASTGLVYGPRPSASLESDPVVAGSPYVESKLLAERACRAWGAKPTRRVEIARLSNVFGNEPPRTVVGDALRHAAAGGPIRLRDHRPIRDFIHVDDAVEGLLLLASGSGEGARVTNVSTGVGRSVGDVARAIGRLAGCAVEEPEADPAVDAGREDRIVLDNGRLRGLGFEPRVGFEAGLAAEIERNRTRP